MIGTPTRICPFCLGSRLAFQTALGWIQLLTTRNRDLPARKRDHLTRVKPVPTTVATAPPPYRLCQRASGRYTARILRMVAMT
jgi:hypothetical protein